MALRSLATSLALAALALGGAARADTSPAVLAKAQARLDRVLAGRTPGAPVDCLQQHQIDQVETFQGIGVLYRVGSTYYLNRPKSGASDLSWDPILVTDTHSDQLCSIDTVRLIDHNSRFYRGFLALDKFVPYPRPGNDTYRGDR